MTDQEIDKRRALYLAALCEKLGEWFPQFRFSIINAHFMWVEMIGRYMSDLSPLAELGIYPKDEKAWTRECTSWTFFVNQAVADKVAKKIQSN